jgi:nicotinamide-nucleotide amidase
MAEGARAQFGSDIAVSITGIAGPDGGSEEKPVGTVWIAVAGPQATDGGTRAVKHFYPTERNRFREYTAALALDAVRRQLLGYTLEFAVK